jgi:hypothetical protein
MTLVTTLFAVLASGASYITVPAAMKLQFKANPEFSCPMALAIALFF